MSADSQTLQAKYQKLAAEFAKVYILVIIMFCEGLKLTAELISVNYSGKIKVQQVSRVG